MKIQKKSLIAVILAFAILIIIGSCAAAQGAPSGASSSRIIFRS